MNTSKKVLALTICTLLFAVGCGLLILGSLMTCCSSVYKGLSFWNTEKFFYGLLPFGASLAIFVTTARVWVRSFAKRRNAWLAGCFAALLTLVGDFNLFLRYRNRYQEINLQWQSESNLFSWTVGSISLPPRFRHMKERGIDTYMGHFTSSDGLEIHYDIGDLAGEHVGMGKFTETLVEGSRVRVAQRKVSDSNGQNVEFVAVSFPDSGCANFYLLSKNPEDGTAIDFIAKSFHPKSRAPSWVLPLLPEPFRSDCRYRFRNVPNAWFN